jgi:hypothetical protein
LLLLNNALAAQALFREYVRMTHIIFVDLDNWGCFFSKLPPGYKFPSFTFVYGVYGGDTQWTESSQLETTRSQAHIPAFSELKSSRRFKLHNKCLHKKNATDFAVSFQVGLLHGTYIATVNSFYNRKRGWGLPTNPAMPCI